MAMGLGLIGRKAGMTRLFTEDGNSIPVTLIEVEPNRVTQVKSEITDGYCALQITVGTCKPSHVNKPISGHFAKFSISPGRGLWEFRLRKDETVTFSVGDELRVDFFRIGQMVDITGTTIGKGFAGSIKRHHFRSQRATHGNSLSHRAPGSIGQNQSPGRVFKGKKMAGHLGVSRRCVQNLEIIQIDVSKNLLVVKGAIPGSRGNDVMIRPAVKLRRGKYGYSN